MAQHDYSLDNQSGAAFRADLNAALAALVSTSSGGTAPSPSFAHMLWMDTSDGSLKQRNGANTAWVVLVANIDTEGAAFMARRGAGSPAFTVRRSSDDTDMVRFRVDTGLGARLEFLHENSGIWAPGAVQLGVFGTRQIFTAATGTWNRPTGMKHCLVRIVGGGGGGGGAMVTTGTQQSEGAGGGGGCGAESWFTASQAGSTRGIAVGAGGSGGTGNNDGAAGGTTSWGTFQVNGGGGGTGGAATADPTYTVNSGGTGGSTASGITAGKGFHVAGGDGGAGVVAAGRRLLNAFGGASMFSGTRRPAAGTLNAVGHGGGGPGVANLPSSAAATGGSGMAGIVIVDEFY